MKRDRPDPGVSTIALLTDFGLQDVYVGVMKGVIARIAPRVRLIDLTHAVPAGDVRAGAFRLWQAVPHMPSGTVFLSVVDPGVGSPRRAVAVSAGGFTFVGPDNGLFTYVLTDRKVLRAVNIDPTRVGAEAPSATFHGRDIFAPAAARLAAGDGISDLGPDAPELVRLPYPRLAVEPGFPAIRGEILCVDRFGNLVTSIGVLRRTGADIVLHPWVPTCEAMTLPATGMRVILPGNAPLALARTFADVSPGEPIGYIGSDGLLEIGVNGGIAASLFRAAPGAEVVLRSP